jgi:hypothetical protein
LKFGLRNLRLYKKIGSRLNLGRLFGLQERGIGSGPYAGNLPAANLTVANIRWQKSGSEPYGSEIYVKRYLSKLNLKIMLVKF